jgi:hypothetical protein
MLMVWYAAGGPSGWRKRKAMKRTRLDSTRSKGGMEVRLDTAMRVDEAIVWSHHVGRTKRDQGA